MDRNKTAKEITLSQLHHWLKENNHLTWNMNGSYGPGAFSSEHADKRRGVPIIKYVFPYMDMRMGHIYHLETEGAGKYVVDFREEFDGNLLDLLKHKIDNKMFLAKDQTGGDYVHELMVNRYKKDIEDANYNS
jgi:hypothetical protein